MNSSQILFLAAIRIILDNTVESLHQKRAIVTLVKRRCNKNKCNEINSFFTTEDTIKTGSIVFTIQRNSWLETSRVVALITLSGFQVSIAVHEVLLVLILKSDGQPQIRS